MWFHSVSQLVFYVFDSESKHVRKHSTSFTCRRFTETNSTSANPATPPSVVMAVGEVGHAPRSEAPMSGPCRADSPPTWFT